jgi:hypothetical protein
VFHEIDEAIEIACVSMYCYGVRATRHFRTQLARAACARRIGRDSSDRAAAACSTGAGKDHAMPNIRAKFSE